MWVFLPIISLLISATVGNPESDSVRSDIIQLENGSNDTFDDRIRKSGMDASKKWKGEESFSAGKNKEQSDDASDGLNGNENLYSNEYNRGVNSDLKILAKRTEAIRSWFDSSLNAQSFGHEKKDPWIYSWGGNSGLNTYEPDPTIHRPIRVPYRFNSWGGKRGNVDGSSEEPKLLHTHWKGKDSLADIFAMVRKLRAADTPWYSNGGKRAQKSSDQESDRQQFVLKMEPNLNNVLRLPASFKDGFDENEESRNDIVEKPVVQTKPDIRTVFDEWDSNRNDFLYRIPLQIINKTRENDYMTRKAEIPDGGYDNNDNWPMSMPNKKFMKHGQFIKTPYNPWAGKRNLKTYDFRYGYDHFAVPAKVKAFFPWGG